MYITSKYPVARAEHIDEDGISWIAEIRAGAGTWVIRDGYGGPFPIVGVGFPFPSEPGLLLNATAEQRARLGMSDEVYQQLNVDLRLQQERQDAPATDRDLRASVIDLRRRLERLESEGL